MQIPVFHTYYALMSVHGKIFILSIWHWVSKLLEGEEFAQEEGKCPPSINVIHVFIFMVHDSRKNPLI